MKKEFSFRKTFLLLTVVIALISCEKKDGLLGKWERISDDYNGMQVLVLQNNNKSYNASIVHCPENADVFSDGDIKWKEIKKVGENRYVFFDLYKLSKGYGDITSNYHETTMLMIGDTLKTRLFSQGNESLGTYQTWVKVGE